MFVYSFIELDGEVKIRSYYGLRPAILDDTGHVRCT
jgi:hypothetical protein